MGYENNVEMVSMAFWTVLKLAGPVLIVALIVGLTIGIIQAATSINEMTLSFVPKVVIVILTIAIFTNYLLIGLTDYFMFILVILVLCLSRTVKLNLSILIISLIEGNF